MFELSHNISSSKLTSQYRDTFVGVDKERTDNVSFCSNTYHFTFCIHIVRLMFLLWCITSLLLIINSCNSAQLCVDSCTFEHDFDATFALPSNCTFVQRDQCDTILTFNFLTRIVNIQFGKLSQEEQGNDSDYTSDNIAHTVIALDGDLSVQHVIEYYCSTGDRCEYDYVLNQALPLYIHKTCQHLRVNLIALLHSDPASTHRPCLLDDGDVSVCDKPCELFYVNPNQTLRSCDGQRDLTFQTTVGRSTPTNKPDYDYRLYAYACTTTLCNGFPEQDNIEKLLQSDDGECLIHFDDGNTTTTSVTPTSTTTTYHNHAISFSKSFVLFVFCFLVSFVF
jgi:hypothetical protein